MSKALSVFGIITATFVLYLFILFTLQLASLPLTGKAVQTANKSINFKIETGNDILEITENIGDVYDALSQPNIPELLSGGTVYTDRGTTVYNQYLRFEDESASLRGAIVNYTEKSGKVSDYMFIDEGSNASHGIFEYELQFEEGLESDISSSKTLEDLEDNDLNVLGRKFRVTTTRIDVNTNEIEVEMVDAALYSTLVEGDKKTLRVGDKEYIVEVLIITDSLPFEVKLKVNNENMRPLKEGEVAALSDGTLVLVDDILSGEAGESSKDMVDVYVDAYKLSFSDTDYTDTAFIQGLKINENTISDGFVSIVGNEISTTEFEIISINYRLISKSELYIGAGHGLREFLTEDGGMITEYWDLTYEGLSKPDTSIIKFDPTSDDRYDMIFTNRRGETYRFPFLNNRGVYNLGDENGNNFTYIEAANTSNYIITDDDYFVVTNKNDRTGHSNVLQYNSIDTSSRILVFNDLVGGTKQTTYTLSNVSGRLGEADLSVGGTTYRVYIENATGNALAIDLTADGVLNSSAANIVVKGGGIFSLGTSNNPTGNFTVSLTTESSQLDEASGNEVISWAMARRSGSEVGINESFSSVALEEEDDHRLGMTRYGVIVDFFDEAEGEAETLTIEYPSEQVKASVYVSVSVPVKEEAKVEEKAEERVEKEEVKQNVSEDIKPRVSEKKAEKPSQVQQTQTVARTRVGEKRGSLLVPILLVAIMLIILVIIGVIMHSKVKPKEPSVFDGYLVR